jgi:uncharacterized protein (TIGR00299 family) protein
MTETILHIDPFSGVSGDMLLGAFLSLGVPLEVIADAVESVIPGEIVFDPVPVKRSGLAGLLCRIDQVGGPGKRSLDEMLTLIDGSVLAPEIKEPALQALRVIGEAEAKVHGNADGPVHLHELGGQDTVTDIVGVMAAVHFISPVRINCGPVNLGSGFVDTSHGRMPVPAPATALLVRDIPVFTEGPPMELTTPTGAAIIGVLTDSYGTIPPMTVTGVGTGAGTRDHKGFPNLLRVFKGRSGSGAEKETAVMIECGVDDVSPEYLAPVSETLQSAGAKEVNLIPVFTKKGRMGALLRVLVSEEDAESLVAEVLRTTGSAGLRFWGVEREVLPRETLTVNTPHGPLPFKRWRSPAGRWRAKPEYEDVKRLAAEAGIPEMEMRDIAMASYILEFGDGQEED